MSLQNQNLKLRSKFYIFFLAFAITGGSFVMGHALVGTALLQQDIKVYNSIPNQDMSYYLSVIITLLPLGAILGSLISGKMVNIYGQKNSMIFVDVLMSAAILLQAASLNLYVLYVTRFTFGLFCGISSAIIPPYLTSISPLNMTGVIGSFNQLLITVGISIAYAMDFFLESNLMDKQYQISIFVLVPLPFCLLRLIVLLFAFPYDTVQRHFQRKQKQAVQEIMNKIYENPSYQQFCRVKNLSHYQPIKKSESQSIFNSKNSQKLNDTGRRRIIYLSIVIAIANQLCGINAIFFYAKQLFTNLTENDQELVKKDLFGLGIFQVIITFLSSLFLDRFGRRFLMLIGQIIIVGSLIGAYIATDVLNLSSSVVVVFVFMHIFGFSISLGPIGCLYASQIMQDISIVIILIWSLTLVVALISDMMIHSLGIGQTFLVFGIISLGCLIYFWKQMIESKGLNRSQLESKFNNKRKCNVRIQTTQQFQEMQEIVSSDN